MDGLFARSLDKNEKLVVIYMDSRGEVSQRSIRVMDIRGEDILVHCFAREKVRTLKKRQNSVCISCKRCKAKKKCRNGIDRSMCSEVVNRFF